MKDESLSEDQQHNAISPLGYRFNLDRRAFFKVLGSGVVVGLSIKSGLSQESGKVSNPHSEEELPNSIAAWIHIAADGRVTVYTGKVEMGQNIRTSLSQQVAEELRVPLSSIQLVMGDTHLTPFDRGTFGSRTNHGCVAAVDSV
jgi:CO/xanthine dehydrogenase Mo-binding subunit